MYIKPKNDSRSSARIIYSQCLHSLHCYNQTWLLQELDLIVLLKDNKDLKLNFYYAILIFCLNIGLKVKRCENPSLDTKKIAEKKLEL